MSPAGDSEDEASNASRDYNAVLEHYVQDDGKTLDLVGMLAYALYKKQKREWIIKHRLEHGGEQPSAEALSAITSHYMTDDMHRTLRERASDILSGYAETYVDAVTSDIRENALAVETLRQAQSIEQAIVQKSSFWSQVWTGIAASFISAGIIALVLLAAKASGSPILDALFPAQ